MATFARLTLVMNKCPTTIIIMSIPGFFENYLYIFRDISKVQELPLCLEGLS